jgi:hypothetical protein
MTFRGSLSSAFGLIGAGRNPQSAQPFDRLLLFNWRGELLFVCAGMLVSFLVAGFWYPYWRIADMDFWVVYNAFLLNAHLPQEYFDHPGYLSILLLSYWLHALHWLGLVKVASLAALPPVSHLADFTRAWTEATRAGRVLSLIYATSFVVTFSYLLRLLVRDWRIAALGGFLLAFSGGMAMQMRILRTELLAAGFFTTALLMLLIVARRGATPWRPAIVGLASALMTLGMSAAHLQFLLEAMAGVIARRIFVLASSPRPTIFLEWFVIAATVIAIRRREWPLVLQVAALMLTDWGVDTLGMSRGLKQEYFLLTDPLAIIAAALLITRLTDLQRHRWTYPLGMALIGAHIVVSQAEPVKHIFKSEGPEVLCGLYGDAKRVQRLPVCKAQAPPS